MKIPLTAIVASSTAGVFTATDIAQQQPKPLARRFYEPEGLARSAWDSIFNSQRPICPTTREQCEAFCGAFRKTSGVGQFLGGMPNLDITQCHRLNTKWWERGEKVRCDMWSVLCVIGIPK
ncbi:hypothetical protein CDD80_1814 [Ophiocordyceps camponoti-rufipedis]|uniref:Uncharacterized protein n=1 Tax=Ophiocordyceps camponoti-rufipedis TaxID=2004952 RepID=A0A2C5XXG3_9HYPO|nr:hypothetical protein CDD80_1814 [Ophiocordyceps camponoti-rufipedis]